MSGAGSLVFKKKQIYFSYSSFCCLFYQARHLRRWDQSAVNILYGFLVQLFDLNTTGVSFGFKCIHKRYLFFRIPKNLHLKNK